jgi:hypothetical protein
VGLTKESYGGWVGDLSHMENPTWWNSRWVHNMETHTNS